MAPGLVDLSTAAAPQSLETDAPNGLKHGPFAVQQPHVNQTSATDEGPISTSYELEDHPIDVVRPVKVAVIGAGISGINAGILLPAKVPGLQLTIFEKNADVSGTWYENSFPGVRCDIVSHVYQSTIEPNTQWTEEYAQGAEIRDYWKHVAQKHGVYKYVRLQTEVTAVHWDEANAKWSVKLTDLATQANTEEQFDVLITAIGRFNAWKLPDYPGMQDYQGHLRHSSNWDPNFDPKGKRVAVIGNGASGIQVLANIQPLVSQLDHYARTPTWIAGSFAGEGEGRKLEPNYYPEDQRKSFEDPDAYLKFRKELEGKFYRSLGKIFKNGEANAKLREEFREMMVKRLKDKPELIDVLTPEFSPNCRRLTPGPGYLEALTKDNVSYITTPIERFTKTGIVTTDGVERSVDAVICSTGANRNMLPPFPIVGKGGHTLQEAWADTRLTYLGLATPGFPNLLYIQGPNGTGHSGTVTNQVETQIAFHAQLLRKVSSQGIKTFEPSQAATNDFLEYSDAFFARTVWTEPCSSWAKVGPNGRIHGHWPGSASHLNIVRRSPRWEDWDWTYKTPTGNRFAYLGNGWTTKEQIEGSDLTPYLKKPEDIDLRLYLEEWFTL